MRFRSLFYFTIFDHDFSFKGLPSESLDAELAIGPHDSASQCSYSDEMSLDEFGIPKPRKKRSRQLEKIDEVRSRPSSTYLGISSTLSLLDAFDCR